MPLFKTDSKVEQDRNDVKPEAVADWEQLEQLSTWIPWQPEMQIESFEERSKNDLVMENYWEKNICVRKTKGTLCLVHTALIKH